MTRIGSRTTDRAAQPNPEDCVHHWRIESPDGRESAGICQRCGSKRNFANSTESVMWERSATIGGDTSRAAVRATKLTDVTLADEA